MVSLANIIFCLRPGVLTGLGVTFLMTVGLPVRSHAQETAGAVALRGVVSKASKPPTSSRNGRVSPNPTSSSPGDVDIGDLYPFDVAPELGQSKHSRRGHATRNAESEVKQGMTSPIVGSKEWQQQQENEERLDRRLNEQIHNICKRC